MNMVISSFSDSLRATTAVRSDTRNRRHSSDRLSTNLRDSETSIGTRRFVNHSIFRFPISPKQLWKKRLESQGFRRRKKRKMTSEEEDSLDWLPDGWITGLQIRTNGKIDRVINSLTDIVLDLFSSFHLSLLFSFPFWILLLTSIIFQSPNKIYIFLFCHLFFLVLHISNIWIHIPFPGRSSATPNL